MNFKKISLVVLSLLMILSVMAFAVSADEQPLLTTAVKNDGKLGLAVTADATASETGLVITEAGKDLKITVSITENTGVEALQFGLKYDPNVIGVVGVNNDNTIVADVKIAKELEQWDAFADGRNIVEDGEGSIRCIFQFFPATNYVGELFTVTFRFSGAKHTDSKIELANVKAYADSTKTDSKITNLNLQNLTLAAHDMGAKSTVEPTCTEAGYSEAKCTGCDFVYKFDEVDALGHDEVVDEAVAATIFTAGKTEGKHCARCGAVLVAQETVPATGAWWIWLIVAVAVLAVAFVVVYFTVIKKKDESKKA